MTVVDERRRSYVRDYRLSATVFTLYSDCPQAFAFERELGIEEVPSRALQVGRLMAMTLEAYLTHCFDNKVASDVSEIDAIARRVFAKDGVGTGPEALSEVLRICQNYVQSHYLDLDRLAGVEVNLPLEAAGPLVLAGREVVGKLDELYFDDDGRLAIVRDAKTNWSVWSEAETRDQLQSKVYPLLIAHSFPDVEEVQIDFDFVRFPGAVRTIRKSLGEIELDRQDLTALAEQMQKPGKRPATPGRRCSFCGFVNLCPRFKTAVDEKVIVLPRTEAEAQKLVEDLAVLEAAVTQRRGALQTWTKEAGPVEKNGIRKGYFETRTPRIPPRAFVEWAEAHGVDPWDYLTVPATDLKSLVRKRKTLGELVTEEVNTRFDTRRGEGDETSVA